MSTKINIGLSRCSFGFTRTVYAGLARTMLDPRKTGYDIRRRPIRCYHYTGCIYDKEKRAWNCEDWAAFVIDPALDLRQLSAKFYNWTNPENSGETGKGPSIVEILANQVSELIFGTARDLREIHDIIRYNGLSSYHAMLLEAGGSNDSLWRFEQRSRLLDNSIKDVVNTSLDLETYLRFLESFCERGLKHHLVFDGIFHLYSKTRQFGNILGLGEEEAIPGVTDLARLTVSCFHRFLVGLYINLPLVRHNIMRRSDNITLTPVYRERLRIFSGERLC